MIAATFNGHPIHAPDGGTAAELARAVAAELRAYGCDVSADGSTIFVQAARRGTSFVLPPMRRSSRYHRHLAATRRVQRDRRWQREVDRFAMPDGWVDDIPF